MSFVTTGLPAAPQTRGRNIVVGTGFAVAASVMYFAGLFAVYIHERAVVRQAGIDWIPGSAKIELTAPTMIMWTLLISIAVMQWAVYSVARDDRTHALLAIGATLAMGGMVLVQYGFQFVQMGLVVDEGPTTAAVLIYTLTGSHIVMVVAAMVFVALMGFRAAAGQFSSHQTDAIVAASMYWYATVFVYFFLWIGVFIAR